MTTRLVLALLLMAIWTGCRRTVPPPGEPMADALRAEEKEGGLTYSASLGKPVFAQYCATCHGDAGKGDGQNAYNLVPPPPDFTTSKNLVDEAYVRRVIAEGSAAVGRSPLSPPYGHTLSPQEIDYVTIYCQALARKK